MRWLEGAPSEHNRDYCLQCDVPMGCSDCPRPELLPVNEAAGELYMRSRTQWNVGFAGPVGLRMEAVEVIARMSGITVDAHLMDAIQTLEMGALQVFSERRDNDGGK